MYLTWLGGCVNVCHLLSLKAICLLSGVDIFHWSKRVYLSEQGEQEGLKTGSQMHVAPRIAVNCWQYAPDVVSDMPQMMLLSNADIKDCL